VKRGLILLLLLSLGLNIGLGLRLAQLSRPVSAAGPPVAPGAPRPGYGPGHGPGQHRVPDDPERLRRLSRHRLERLGRELDLTPEQVESLGGVHETMGRRIHGARRAVEEERRRMRSALTAGEIDRAGLTAGRRAVGRLQAELDSLVVETMLQELAILHPEQRERYLEMLPWEPLGQGRRGAGRGGAPRAREGR
jgi:Spy/CpxP family protein refolding chaperone